jgi:hypothetical protein
MSIYLVSGICGLAGGAMLLFVLKRFIGTLVFIRSGHKTVGKVVGLANARTSDHHLTYLPVFEFRTNDGQIIHYTSTVASNPPPYQIGATVELFFQTKNPRQAKINSFSELWLTTIVLLFISLVLFLFAFLAFFSGK